MKQPAAPESLNSLLDSQFFKALSDSSRLSVLVQLASLGNGKTVTEIAACCPQSISVVSRHLKILKESGIVKADKQGKAVTYTFLNREVAAQLRKLANALECCC